MKRQKFIFHSKNIWSAILTFLIAVCPLLLKGVNSEFDEVLIGEIIALIGSTLATVYFRYVAHGTLYTPRGLPGRDYVPAWKEGQ